MRPASLNTATDAWGGLPRPGCEELLRHAIDCIAIEAPAGFRHATARASLPPPPFSRRFAGIWKEPQAVEPNRENLQAGRNADKRGAVKGAPAVQSGRRRRSHQTTKRRRWRRIMANS